MRTAARYLRVSVPAAMKLPEQLIEKAVIAAQSNYEYEQYLLEQAKKKT